MLFWQNSDQKSLKIPNMEYNKVKKIALYLVFVSFSDCNFIGETVAAEFLLNSERIPKPYSFYSRNSWRMSWLVSCLTVSSNSLKFLIYEIEDWIFWKILMKTNLNVTPNMIWPHYALLCSATLRLGFGFCGLHTRFVRMLFPRPCS